LLMDSLKLLCQKYSKKVTLVVYGQYCKQDSSIPGLSISCVGSLTDDLSLYTLYNALDILAVPSRKDNLPNTAVEANACGIPVVAFDIGGLGDIVEHKKTGYLSQPFSIDDFCKGIIWTLEQDQDTLKDLVRHRFLDRFSSVIVAEKYVRVYKKVLLKNKS